MMIFADKRIDLNPQADDLACLVYRSRATDHFEEPGLESLVNRAQGRNATEQLSGALFYDDGRFLQWLEGPQHALARVIHSIDRDARHTDIQLLSYGETASRSFADWSLHLLRHRADVPRVLNAFAGAVPDDRAGLPPLADYTTATEAALRLTGGQDDAAVAMLQSAGGTLSAEVTQCEDMMESLASLWSADACDGTGITIGLCKLLSVFRRARQQVVRPFPLGPATNARPVALCGVPRQPNPLGMALAAEVLTDAGYAVHAMSPEGHARLVRELGDRTAGGLVLVSDGVFTQAHHARELEALARDAGPRLVADAKIGVYGRIARSATPLCGPASSIEGAWWSANDLPALFARLPELVH